MWPLLTRYHHQAENLEHSSGHEEDVSTVGIEQAPNKEPLGLESDYNTTHPREHDEQLQRANPRDAAGRFIREERLGVVRLEDAKRVDLGKTRRQATHPGQTV